MRMYLRDIADFINGYGFKQTDWNNDGLPIIRIQNLTDESKPFNRTIRNTDKKYIIERGDILVSWSATLGVFEWSREKALLNQHIFKVIPNSQIIDKKYLFYSLKNALSEMNKHLHGATMRHINRKEFVNTKINVPSLDEQRRIAKILDLEHKIQQSYEDKYKKYCELLKSTFVYFFGEPCENPKGFPSCTLGDLIHFAKDGPHVSPEYSDSDGIPFLSTRHVRPGEIIWDDMKFINQEEANKQWKKCKPIKGDILYTKGGTTGLAAEVKTNLDFAVWVHIALLRPNTLKVHPSWLESMLNTNYAYFQSQRYTHGIANKDLGLTRMKKIKLYLPPLSEQLKFVSFVRNHEKNIKLVSDEQSQIKEMISSTQSNFFSKNK